MYAQFQSIIKALTARLSNRDIQRMGMATLCKAAEDQQDFINSFMDYYADLSWDELADTVAIQLKSIAIPAGEHSVAQLHVSNASMIHEVNAVAGAWADERAAEMVGMRRNDQGVLVPNPNAEWAITDTTREQLRAIVTDAFEHNTSMKQLIADIRDAGAFSKARAKMIARTEAALAQSQGNLAGWKTSGMVKQVNWHLSIEHNPAQPCLCPVYAAESPFDIEDVPRCPAHVNCCCSISARLS